MSHYTALISWGTTYITNRCSGHALLPALLGNYLICLIVYLKPSASTETASTHVFCSFHDFPSSIQISPCSTCSWLIKQVKQCSGFTPEPSLSCLLLSFVTVFPTSHPPKALTQWHPLCLCDNILHDLLWNVCFRLLQWIMNWVTCMGFLRQYG